MMNFVQERWYLQRAKISLTKDNTDANIKDIIGIVFVNLLLELHVCFDVYDRS